MNRIMVWAPLGVILVLLALLGWGLVRPGGEAGGPMTGQPLPALALEPFEGGRGAYDPALARGPYLLNFWASWCPPCIVEHPYFAELDAQGVPIFAIVYKDRPQAARNFLDTLGDPFAGLAADPDGRAAFELGVTGPPETFIIDSQGVIRARWRGAVTGEVWARHLDGPWREAGGPPVNLGALRAAGR